MFQGPDGFSQTNYILTQDGQIFKWGGGRNALEGFLVLIGWIFFGIIVNLISVVILAEEDGVWRS
jgi:hypothetical protein